jgi:hypothetical protein
LAPHVARTGRRQASKHSASRSAAFVRHAPAGSGSESACGHGNAGPFAGVVDIEHI